MTEHHTTPRHANLRIRARQDARSLHARASKPLRCVRARCNFIDAGARRPDPTHAAPLVLLCCVRARSAFFILLLRNKYGKRKGGALYDYSSEKP